MTAHNDTSKRFFILGTGSLGKHLANYFRHFTRVENLSFRSHLDTPQKRQKFLSQLTEGDRVLHATRDQDTLLWMPELNAAKAFHGFLSASLFSKLPQSFSLSYGCALMHPLMSFFSESNFTLEEYRQIPFFGNAPEKFWRERFPFLENPYQQMPAEDFAEYHSRVALACTLTSMLWNDFSDHLRHQKINPQLMHPILAKVARNLQNHPGSMTGPLSRGERDRLVAYSELLKNNRHTPHSKMFGEIYHLLSESIQP